MTRFSTLLNCRLSFWFCLVAVFTAYVIFRNFGASHAASPDPSCDRLSKSNPLESRHSGSLKT